MKRIGWLVLILVLSLPAFGGCGQPGQVAPKTPDSAFDALARWVPGDTLLVMFLDLKPGGETGRRWERIRPRLEANETGKEAIASIFQQFRVEEYGLEEFTEGPAVNWSDDRGMNIIVQVSDEQAAADTLRRHFESVTWEQKEFEGKTLYHGKLQPANREQLGWTIHDDLLFLSYRYDGEAFTPLQAIVSLAEADSLAALPAWRTLRDRLPAASMGLIFANLAEQVRRNPPAPDDTSLGTALGRQLGAIALAAVPEDKGMRVEMAGTVALQTDASPRVRALFNSPAVDPAVWTNLPADTAIALFAHDASVHWLWLKEAFFNNPDSLAQLRDTVGLDLEADLVGAEGPLAGDFAVAIIPPLAGQPISQGLAAGQLLIVARGASAAQMDTVRTAMEGRGATFGPGEVEDVAVQTQAGTKPTGYAISYGFDGETLLFGSSPGIVGQGVAARREGKGLVKTPTFQAMLAALPDTPSLVIYLNSGALVSLARANMTEEQFKSAGLSLLAMEAFEAIGLGLRRTADGLDGTLYFLVRE